jgi:hypothetical protein
MRIAVAIALAAGFAAGCAPSERESDYLARRARLERQNKGIRELIEEAERGSLLPADRFLIGIDEQIVGDLFRSQLPLERPLGKQLVVRLDRANIDFRDKYGVITVEGEVYRLVAPDQRAALRVHGGLGDVRIDPVTDLLTIRIAIDHVEVLQAGVLENVLGRGGKELMASKGREMLQDQLPTLNVPVGLARSIQLPAFDEGGIRIDSLTVPLHLAVERVIALEHKLWVTLDARVGEIEGGEQGMKVAVVKKRKGKR